MGEEHKLPSLNISANNPQPQNLRGSFALQLNCYIPPCSVGEPPGDHGGHLDGC
jgi:hypothetical protein